MNELLKEKIFDFNHKSSKLEGNSLPKEFKDFKNFHSGETILVCGCGSSLNELMNPELFLTIGVNDVGRLFQPNYLVVLNARQEFRFGRFKFVEESQSQALFTHLSLGIKHPHIIQFNLGKFNGVDFNDPTVLPYTRNSPYVALCLAIHMGAKRIGLIGVDFTDNHFFAKTGRHNLTNDIRQIDREYTFLYKSCQRLGIEVFNLSSESRLSTIPKISINDFAQLSKLSTFTKDTIDNQNNINVPLKIVSYSTTPVVGVPAILARCINSRTIHSARCVWAENGYGNGIIFDGDIQWNQSPRQAETVLEDADLIIVHNGKVATQHQSILTDKAIITMAHNYMGNVDQSFVKRGFPGVVVGQYPAALPEFKDWLIVPNPIPLWEEAYQPGQKDSTVTICFTPSGKPEKYPSNNHLYWHSKGYDTTMKVLKQLAARFPLRLEVIDNKQISHAQSLAMKRRSHIVIDECVTGGYHRNSLEGLAAGCLVVNGMGLLENLLEISRYCTGSNTPIPFLSASLDNLEKILISLIEKGAEALTREGVLNYQWMQQHWDFEQQWKTFWRPAVDKAMQQIKDKPAKPKTSQLSQTPTNNIPSVTKQGLSTIICHGGQERLPLLSTTLTYLQHFQDIDEIILVEMSELPFAEELARQWSVKYIFVHHQGQFEKARALNIGSAFAENDLLLWLDSDVLPSEGFIKNAISEMRSRLLDHLVPFSCVHYLSEEDSKAIIAGTRNPVDCKPTNIGYSALHGSGHGLYRLCGHASIVKKVFIEQFGGVCEEFRGWGGEDDAWVYKANLLGTFGITSNHNQYLYHLYHANSRGYDGGGQRNHPHYSKNMAILQKIRAIKDPGYFLKCFPPPLNFSCPWDKNTCIRFITEKINKDAFKLVEEIAEILKKLFAVKTEHNHFENSAIELNEEQLMESNDSIVVFGLPLTFEFLSKPSFANLYSSLVIIDDNKTHITNSMLKELAKVGAILTKRTSEHLKFKEIGLRSWLIAEPTEKQSNNLNFTLTLAQTLSIILGNRNTKQEKTLAVLQ